ncbi:nitrilase-related carbon-nitrogen hydrolase [Pigmentiphaga daeguensis]|uniref:CN hydrolase domain-containing protein n=1 Tax=Pigmentiphaga daeguensis TaxID=414049 RepID=A0ABN1CFI4_9BURK
MPQAAWPPATTSSTCSTPRWPARASSWSPARATGAAHWHALLRARAIENGAFVLAPATCGDSPGGRASYGHSLALGPWGDTLGELGDEPDCLTVPLDLAAVTRVRAELPGLSHERAFSLRLAGPSPLVPSDGMPHDTTA